MKPHIHNFFKFLNEKENKDYPFKVKLIYFPKKITKEDLIVSETLDLSNSDVKYLPDNLKIFGDLYLDGSSIIKLPNNLFVTGSLDIEYTNIKNLPNDLNVGYGLYLKYSPIIETYSYIEIKKMFPNIPYIST